LHGDLSPNNFIIFDGRGYFIDFDHAQIITQVNTTAIDRANGGESAVIEHTASDDLESLFYIFI
ncbi:hypothetical protein CY34DRAFT_30616, partial [Suillus luteus UH-Slu-Lm8-n1]